MSNKRKIFALVNRKGGVSKTTSAAYLAMCLHQSGRQVTGIDTDSEKSWLKWHSAGVLPYSVIEGEGSSLRHQIEKIKGDVVIDTPPNDGEVIYKAAGLADEVIIPLAPTALDVNRLASTLNVVADVEGMRDKALGSVLLTKWRDGLVISQEVQAALEEEEVPLLETRIRNLTRYQGFSTPDYLDEYKAVLKELEVL